MLARPIYVECLSPGPLLGALGVAVSQQLIQSLVLQTHPETGEAVQVQQTSLYLTVCWDTADRDITLVGFNEVKWLSIPGITDGDDTAIEDLLFEVEEDGGDEPDPGEASASPSETEGAEEGEEAEEIEEEEHPTGDDLSQQAMG